MSARALRVESARAERRLTAARGWGALPLSIPSPPAPTWLNGPGSLGSSLSPAPSPSDLDARAKNECYRATFRLPLDERLDGHTSCTLWAPFSKLHVPGVLFISGNYICFASKEEDACHLIIPLREVSAAASRGRQCSPPPTPNRPFTSGSVGGQARLHLASGTLSLSAARASGDQQNPLW